MKTAIVLILLCLTTAVSFGAVRPGTSAQTPTKKISISFEPGILPPALQGSTQDISVALKYEAPTDRPSRTINLKLFPPKGITVTPASQDVVVIPGKSVPVAFTVSYDTDILPQTRITAETDTGDTAILKTGVCYDISTVTLRAKLDTEGPASQEWISSDFADSSWPVSNLPFTWAKGTAYLRAHLYVPESWRGKDLYLRLKSLEGTDVCYLNGKEIGRSGEAGKSRTYKVDPASVKYGADNLLCIVAKSPKSEGVIPQHSIYFGIDIPE